MNRKKSLILSLVMVLVAGLSIVAGTFAYFQWQAAVGTQVNVTIEIGGIKMHIEPEQTGFVGLYPTVHCENNVKYGDTLVKIENNTGTLAIPSFKLSVAINPSVADSGQLDYYKEHVHYAVVALETTKDAGGNPVKGNPVGGNVIDDLVTGTCKLPLTVSATTDNDDTFRSDYGKSATGLFNVITEENVFADTAMLPREYNSSTGEVQGVTFRGEAYSTSYQYYRVYVWVDEGYTSTIVGDTISDPLQNATIQVTWSENSMLQQVSGVSNVEEEVALAAGLYDEDGTFTSWEELVENGKIVVTETILTSVSDELIGDLVVKEGITEIGEMAFEYNEDIGIVIMPDSVVEIANHAFRRNSIEEVRFSANSNLKIINSTAFYESYAKIVIPSGVEYIGEYAIEDFFPVFLGTVEEWNAIEKSSLWNPAVVFVECSDGVTDVSTSGLYNSNGVLQYSWDQLLSNEIIRLSEWDDTEITNYYDVPDFENGILIIPEGMMRTGSVAFGWSNNFDVVIIPASFTYIGNEAFTSSSVSKVLFGANSQLSHIGYEAFRESNLSEISLSSTVTFIDNDAFFDASLERLYYKGTTAQWDLINKAESSLGFFSIDVVCSDGIVHWTSGEE